MTTNMQCHMMTNNKQRHSTMLVDDTCVFILIHKGLILTLCEVFILMI